MSTHSQKNEATCSEEKLSADIRRFERRENFRRACRLNPPRCFADLRSLYQLCATGVKFGNHSGYAP